MKSTHFGLTACAFAVVANLQSATVEQRAYVSDIQPDSTGDAVISGLRHLRDSLPLVADSVIQLAIKSLQRENELSIDLGVDSNTIKESALRKTRFRSAVGSLTLLLRRGAYCHVAQLSEFLAALRTATTLLEGSIGGTTASNMAVGKDIVAFVADNRQVPNIIAKYTSKITLLGNDLTTTNLSRVFLRDPLLGAKLLELPILSSPGKLIEVSISAELRELFKSRCMQIALTSAGSRDSIAAKAGTENLFPICFPGSDFPMEVSLWRAQQQRQVVSLRLPARELTFKNGSCTQSRTISHSETWELPEGFSIVNPGTESSIRLNSDSIVSTSTVSFRVSVPTAKCYKGIPAILNSRSRVFRETTVKVILRPTAEGARYVRTIDSTVQVVPSIGNGERTCISVNQGQLDLGPIEQIWARVATSVGRDSSRGVAMSLPTRLNADAPVFIDVGPYRSSAFVTRSIAPIEQTACMEWKLAEACRY